MNGTGRIDPISNPAMDGDLGGLRKYGDGERVASYDGYILVTKDGEFIEPVQNAKNDVERARHTLWNRIGPLQYGDIELSYRTEVWHEDREEWWRATKIDLYSDGEPVVTFERKGTEPREFVRVYGSQLADMVREDTLTSKAAVNDRAEEMFWSLRTESDQ